MALEIRRAVQDGYPIGTNVTNKQQTDRPRYGEIVAVGGIA